MNRFGIVQSFNWTGVNTPTKTLKTTFYPIELRISGIPFDF